MKSFFTKAVFIFTFLSLFGCVNGVDLSSIDMKNMNNQKLTELINKTEMKRAITSDKGDVGDIEGWVCSNKLILFPNGTVEYSTSENVTDFGANKTHYNQTYRGRWKVNPNGTTLGRVSQCIGTEFDYTYLEISLENGIKNTALMYLDDGSIKLIDCDLSKIESSYYCEKIEKEILIIPFGNLLSQFDF